MRGGGGVRFVPNPRAAQQLARAPEMRRYMQSVADTAAGEVDSRKPELRGGRRIHIDADTDLGPDGWEGRVVIRSPFWHLFEFGSRNNPARPYVRPGVQAALSRVRGRWRST